MKIQMKRIIASMLVVIMVLSNGNLTVLAGETGSKSEPVVEEQSNLDNALPSTSGENAGEAVKENGSNTQTEEQQQENEPNTQTEEQQQENGSNIQMEEQQQENEPNAQTEEQQKETTGSDKRPCSDISR